MWVCFFGFFLLYNWYAVMAKSSGHSLGLTPGSDHSCVRPWVNLNLGLRICKVKTAAGSTAWNQIIHKESPAQRRAWHMCSLKDSFSASLGTSCFTC